mmetsp:Transcript_14876/g.44061  ORF Transcript_14876/g.44061 Transcript_14876/m.44061 type:complete len:403 (-) Transcript_14876:1388-2596(-)
MPAATWVVLLWSDSRFFFPADDLWDGTTPSLPKPPCWKRQPSPSRQQTRAAVLAPSPCRCSYNPVKMERASFSPPPRLRPRSRRLSQFHGFWCARRRIRGHNSWMVMGIAGTVGHGWKDIGHVLPCWRRAGLERRLRVGGVVRQRGKSLWMRLLCAHGIERRLVLVLLLEGKLLLLLLKSQLLLQLAARLGQGLELGDDPRTEGHKVEGVAVELLEVQEVDARLHLVQGQVYFDELVRGVWTARGWGEAEWCGAAISSDGHEGCDTTPALDAIYFQHLPVAAEGCEGFVHFSHDMRWLLFGLDTEVPAPSPSRLGRPARRNRPCERCSGLFGLFLVLGLHLQGQSWGWSVWRVAATGGCKGWWRGRGGGLLGHGDLSSTLPGALGVEDEFVGDTEVVPVAGA